MIWIPGNKTNRLDLEVVSFLRQAQIIPAFLFRFDPAEPVTQHQQH